MARLAVGWLLGSVVATAVGCSVGCSAPSGGEQVDERADTEESLLTTSVRHQAIGTPKFAVSPRHYAPPGSRIVLQGEGYGPLAAITAAFDGVGVATTVADEAGRFALDMSTPKAAPHGHHHIRVEDEQGYSADASYTIRTNASHEAFDKARTAFNPYENEISASNVARLHPVWSFDTGVAKPLTQAIVASGRVYFADGGGTVWALDAETGGVVWSYATGAVISHAPVAAYGRIYVATYSDGTFILDAKSGKLSWAAQQGGGDVLAYDGSIFTLGLTAFGAAGCGSAACEPRWSAQVIPPSYVERLSAFDGLVYSIGIVRGTSGYVFTLVAARAAGCEAEVCRPLWTADFGDAAFRATVVTSGLVVVPTNVIAAFDAKSGNLSWTAARGPLDFRNSQIAAAYGRVYAYNGVLSSFDVRTGKLAWHTVPNQRIAQDGGATGAIFVANHLIFLTSPIENLLYVYSAACQDNCLPLLKRSVIQPEPPIVTDGFVFIPQRGTLVALRAD